MCASIWLLAIIVARDIQRETGQTMDLEEGLLEPKSSKDENRSIRLTPQYLRASSLCPEGTIIHTSVSHNPNNIVE